MFPTPVHKLGLTHEGEYLAPWRQVSRIHPDGNLIYYAPAHARGCLLCQPSAACLTRHELFLSDLKAHHADIPDNTALLGRCVLFIVNPKSGTGAAATMKSNVDAATAILTEAGLQSVVRYTERARHGEEMLAAYGNAALRQFAAVLSVGGDGTLHEVLNGLVATCHTPDMPVAEWHGVPPLAVLPGGSGNAVAVSMGIVSAQHAALNIVHSLRAGLAKPLAVMQYRQLSDSKRERLVVGGVQWGLPADVDQGTEHLRFIGDVRFDIGAVLHILQKKQARARIKITVDVALQQRSLSEIGSARAKKNGDSAESEVFLGEKVAEDTYILDGKFIMLVAWSSSCIGDSFMVTPRAKVTETGVFDVIVSREGISRMDMVTILLNSTDGSFMSKSDQYLYFKASRLEFETVDGKYLTVDGEAVPVEPFVLEMAPEDGHVRILDAFSES